jgi:hypothetical protein
MLVIPQDGFLRLTFQHDHANLSGRIAAAWRAEHIAHRERLGEILEAVGGHDSGWQEADRQGFLDEATGRPASFLELPYQSYPPLWTESIQWAARRGPLAGYLVARHFASLSTPRGTTQAEPEGEAALGAFRASTEETLASLAGEIPPPSASGPYPLAENPLDNDFRFLQLNDLLSLVVCGGHAEPELLDYLRTAHLGGEPIKAELPEPHILLLAPWVFEPERFEDAVPIHIIPDRAYPDGASLAEAIAAAEAARQPVRIEPF